MKSKVFKNNNLKIIIVVAIVSVVLIISGCGAGGSTQKINYHIGTDGVVMQLATSNEDVVFENQISTRVVTLKNMGTYGLQNNSGVLSVGYDSYYFTLNGDAKKTVKLHARDQEYPVGDQEIYEFNFNANKITNLREKPETQISYSVCYPYHTTVTFDKVCIDTKANQQDTRKKVCTPTNYEDSQGQGAPVAITRIVPQTLITGGIVKPKFQIFMQNRGKGYVISRTEGTNICTNPNAAEINTNINKVHVQAMLSKTILKCTPEDVRLEDAESYTTCYVDIPQDAQMSQQSWVYSTLLTVDISYAYVERQVEDITIQRIE